MMTGWADSPSHYRVFNSPRQATLAGGMRFPAITYSRVGRHYHRPGMLNGRVRNGNGWGHPGLLTGKGSSVRGGSDKGALHGPFGTSPGSRRSSAWLLVPVSSGSCLPYTPGLSTWWSSRILHPTGVGDLILPRASRLDAFSVYPGRTLATQR